MSDLKSDDGKQAIYCLEHLLYEIPFTALHNVAALLAQETGRPVTEFAEAMGHWTFEVVERFLWDRGMKCVPTTRNGHWYLDMSPNFLRRDPGFVGFIVPQTLESYAWSKEGWFSSDKTKEEDVLSKLSTDTVVVYRMWSPIQPLFEQNKAFHITTDDWKWRRDECRPDACWRKENVCYDGRSRSVKAYMRSHREEPIMMSSSKEIVLCRPTKSGWRTETLTNYECLNLKQSSARVLETLMQKLNTILDEDKACVIMSHVAYSVLTYMGGRLTPQDCSALSPDELELLQQYEMGLLQVTK
ncbi:hypothetical protein N9A45_01405 [bacterium]|nr:hypothetical protein [bacterium]